MTLEKPLCSNCGTKIDPKVTEVDMIGQTDHDESLTPGRMLLHVVSILYIIFGSLGTLWALFGLSITNYVDLNVQHLNSMSWLVYYVIFLLRSCFHLGVGIVGIINRKRVKNAPLLRILGCIDIGFVVLRIIIDAVFLSFGISSIVVNVIIGMIFPILYIIGASRNLRVYRNNQKCQYYKIEIKQMEYRVFKYIGFLGGITILAFVFSRIFDIGAGNTWLELVYITAIGLVIVKMFLDIATFFKEKHFHISRLCIFFGVMVVIGLIVHTLSFFIGW